MAQRTVTVHVLFTDLVGSTRLISSHGADGADALRRAHDEVVRAAITANAGEIVKHTGDGVMATFGSALDAVAAAGVAQRSLQRARRRTPGIPEVRIGVSSGEATHEDGDWFGPPVIEAARLCAEAAGGQILATQIVALLVGARGEHRLEPLGERVLKGFDAPVEVYEVPWAQDRGPVLALPDPAVSVERGPLIGRDAPRRDLLDAWKAAQDGRPRIVLVAGEPGVGKTRLVAGLAREIHSSGAIVLWGRCDEDLSVAYQPFSEALRRMVTGLPVEDVAALDPSGDLVRLVPELGDLLRDLPPPRSGSPEDERLQLMDATAAFLARGLSVTDPVLLVVDDLHWAATATLQMLRQIARLPGPAPILVLGTYRDTEPGDEPGWQEAMSDLWRESDVQMVRLAGLDTPAVVELVERAAGEALGEDGQTLASAVREQADGNPFFIGQILRHLVETGELERSDSGWVSRRPLDELGLPDGVREVVGHRLRRLPPGTRRGLVIAAIVGQRFDLGVVARALEGAGVDTLVDDFDHAVTARLVEEVDAEPGRYAFVHALVRQTLLADLTATKRAQLHRAIGQTLSTTAGADAASVARHLCAGAALGGAADAMAWCLTAILDAQARLDFPQVVDLAARGLQAADHDDPTRAEHHVQRAWLLLAMADGRNDEGDIPGSKRDFLLAADEARIAGDVGCLIDAALGRITWGQSSTLDPEGRALLEEVRGLVPDDDLTGRARLDSALAFYLWVYEGDDSGRPLALARAAVELSARTGMPRARRETLSTLSFILMAGPDTDEQLRIIAELEDATRTLGGTHHGFVLDTIRQRIPVLVQIGDRAGLRDAIAEFSDKTADARLHEAILAMWRGMSALLDGDLDACERHLQQLIAGAEDDVNLVNSWAAQSTYLQWERGGLGEVIPLLDQAVRDLPRMVGMRALLSAVLAEHGDVEAARAHLTELTRDDLAAVPADALLSGSLAELASAAVRLADADAAVAIHRHLAPFSGQLLVVVWGVVCLGAADRHLALLDELAGRTEDADRRFEAAVTLEDRFEAPALAARTRLWWGHTLLERSGDDNRKRGRDLLLEAETAARDLGLTAIADEASLLLS